MSLKRPNTIALLYITLLISTAALCQDLQDLSILAADASYGKEIIKLPVDWAPNMNIEGFEELRFSPGWNELESPQFWSYVLAWNIKRPSPLSTSEIEQNLEQYFDGLMKPNHWATAFPEPVVVLFPSEDKNTKQQFKGRMKYFDGFYTGKMMTTYILAEQTFCATTQRAIVVFRISPKTIDHEVWKELATIQKKPNSCNSN